MAAREKVKTEKSSTGIIKAGLFVLLLCIALSIIMVVVQQDTYRSQVSKEFHQQHVSMGEYLNSLLMGYGQGLMNVAWMIGGRDEDSIQARIATTSELTALGHIYYINAMGELQEDGEDIEGGSELMFEQLQELSYPKAAAYIGLAPSAVRLFTGSSMVIAAPVRTPDYGISSVVFSTIDIEGIFESDAFAYQTQKGQCLLVSDAGEIIAGAGRFRIVDQNDESFQLGLLEHSDKEGLSKRAVQDFNYGIAKKTNGFVTIKTADGYRMQVSYSPLNDCDGMHFVSCFQDNLIDQSIKPLIFTSVLTCSIIIVVMIGALTLVWISAKSTNLTVERLAYEDPVTKGKNLNYFREFALNTMISNRETPFIIYRFDIANFRYINESYGHHRADMVLVSCIKNFERLFSERELCVRMDADQFLALLINDSLLDKKMDEFTNAVNADARGNQIKYPIRFKYGIYPVKKHDHDIDVMIDHANVAKKTIKSDSKETKALYTERFVDDMRKVDHIESSMQKALAENEFKVYLQTKWDIIENRVTGAEALVRWVRPNGSVLGPEQFVPIFENNGFIEQLDFYTLESVCMRMREMMDDGIDVVPVSVNQSRLLLHSPDYVENVEKVLKQYNIPPGAIELEITESVFDNEKEDVIAIIRRLKMLGVRLSMDDFGTGYSSLNMLTEVPFDVIKIDGEYFARSAESEQERMVLGKIVEIIKDLGMEVVCEGVESEAQVEYLKTTGCRTVQGYYFSIPVPEPEFITRYLKKNE